MNRLQQFAGIKSPKVLYENHQCFYIDDYPIHGKGLFTKMQLPANQYISLMGNQDQLNKYAQHINHSKEGNSTAKLFGNNIYLYSLKDINPEEEITSDYTKLPSMFDNNIEGFV